MKATQQVLDCIEGYWKDAHRRMREAKGVMDACTCPVERDNLFGDVRAALDLATAWGDAHAAAVNRMTPDDEEEGE
jgi:hypothetical protein